MIGPGWRDPTDGWADQGAAGGDQPPGEGGESGPAPGSREEEEEGGERDQDRDPVQLRQEARCPGKTQVKRGSLFSDKSDLHLAGTENIRILISILE